MNEELRAKKSEPVAARAKCGARRLTKKDSGAVAEPSIPKCNLGTRGRGQASPGVDAETAEVWLPQRSTGKLIPIRGDVILPGEASRDRRSRLAREANALAAERVRQEPEELPTRMNPLFALTEERAEKLFTWLRECPYHDAVKAMLAEQGIPDVTDKELEDFFQSEADGHWQRRLSRAATEANALVTYIETHPVKFSAGILAALGQEAFRQIASGQVAPEAMARMTHLFLKARADERSDRILDLRREKLEHEWKERQTLALEAFAAEIEKHPEARGAFEALRLELAGGREEGA